MSKLIIPTTDYQRVLQRVCEADSAAFYVGADKLAVSGGRLTAKAGDGVVMLTSNRLSEDSLREIFSDLLLKDTEDGR